MRFRNTTRGDLSAGGVTFPAGATADTTEGFNDAVAGDVVFAAWVNMGWLVMEGEAKSPDAQGRASIIAGIIRNIGADRLPKVSAINRAMPDDMDRVTAAERDAIWADMQERDE